MKFATHVLAFGQDKWIMKNIENAYPYIDRIYVAYSEYPWGYNKNARSLYHEKMDLDKIKKSKFYDKVCIIEGVWDTEEQQRNECVDRALADGMDYLFIHDADEFYSHKCFQNLVDTITANPDYGLYRCGWYNFWKDMLVTVKKDGSLIAGYPDICINIKDGVRFRNKRTPDTEKIFTIKDSVCFHLSYVMTDEEIKRKLDTWGHTNDFNTQKWYSEKWLGWTPETTGLHPIQPNEWYKAIPFTGELPEILR